MATRVFISWSGDLSKKLGETLRDWLPKVLQHVDPYFAPDDIEKGAQWPTNVAENLQTTDIGIICLTPKNMKKPWILFEAGALSKSFEESRVCTLLFNLEPPDLKGPLTHFQTTEFTKEDVKQLVEDINEAAAEEKLPQQSLDDIFETWWPQLEKDIRNILESASDIPPNDKRSDRDILEEILELSRANTSPPDNRDKIDVEAVRDMNRRIYDMLPRVRGGDLESIAKGLASLLSPLEHMCQCKGVYDEFEHLAQEMDMLLDDVDHLSQDSK